MIEVSGVVGLLLRLFPWLAKLWPKFFSRFRDDHVTLTSGWFAKAFSGQRHFYVNVACAPSRVRRFSLTPQAAKGFVEQVFPDAGFPEHPNQATKGYVVFEVVDEPGGDRFPRMVRFYANGLIEVSLRLSLVAGALETGAVLAVTEFLEPLYRLGAAVNAGLYRELYSTRAKLDWFFAVSPSVNHDRGFSSWEDLVFPGTRPENRASDHVASISSGGYAGEELRGLSQRTKPQRLVKAVLEDMLQQCGFYDSEQAIEDSVSALVLEPKVGSTN